MCNIQNGHRHLGALHILYQQQPTVLDRRFIEIRQWLTAEGRLIRKQGIEPDVALELPIGTELLYPSTIEDLSVDELLESEDAQVLKALELLEALPEAVAP